MQRGKDFCRLRDFCFVFFCKGRRPGRSAPIPLLLRNTHWWLLYCYRSAFFLRAITCLCLAWNILKVLCVRVRIEKLFFWHLMFLTCVIAASGTKINATYLIWTAKLPGLVTNRWGETSTDCSFLTPPNQRLSVCDCAVLILVTCVLASFSKES